MFGRSMPTHSKLMSVFFEFTWMEGLKGPPLPSLFAKCERLISLFEKNIYTNKRDYHFSI